MRRDGRIPFWVRFLAKLILFAVVIMLVSTALAWPIGWRSAYQLGSCFFLTGALVAVAGVFSVIGNWGSWRRFHIQYAESAGSDSIYERAARAAKDLNLAFSFTFQLFLVGLIIIFVSIMLQTFFD